MNRDQPPPAADTTGPPSWMAPVKPVVPDHEMIRRIGGGSYGDVWLARNAVGTWRAVKVVFRDRFLDARPYEREFSGMQKFEPLSRANEGFIDILQIGRNDEAGYFYYVMELADDAAASDFGGTSSASPHSHSPELESEPRVTRPSETVPALDPDSYIPKTLSKVLLQRGRLLVSECLELGITLNLGLAHLHRAGLIHRDIKPSNLIFVGGVPKLADIGLVIETCEARSYVGTEGFIPPEGPTSPQADLYSLGKVLYEAGMGKDRKDFPEPFTQIADAPDSAQLLEFNAILLKACAANVKQRYQSAEEMNADLALLQSGGSVRRQRKLAGQLRFVQRAGAAVTALAALIAAGWLWQARQTHIVRELAAEKATLAEKDRWRLARQRVANGVRLMNEGDLNMALLWFAESLPLVEADAEQARIHRIRLGSILNHAPRLLHVLPHDDSVKRCGFSPDGKWLLTTDRTNARVWQVSNGLLVAPPFRHAGLIWFSGFSPQGTEVLTSDSQGVLRVWDSAENWQPRVIGTNITFCAWQPGQRAILACLSNGPARLLETTSGKILHEFAHGGAQVFGGAFSEDGRLLATADAGGEVRVWSAETGRSLSTLIATGRSMKWGPVFWWRMPLQFDRAARRLLIVTEDGSVPEAQVWEWAKSQRLCGPFRANSGVIGGAALSADGASVALVNEHDRDAGKPGAIEIWEAGLGKLVRTLSASISGNGAAFDRQSGALAAMSWDGFAQLWNSDTGQALTPPLWHSAWVMDMAFSADGRLFATAGDDGIVKVWRLAPSQSELWRFTNSPHGDHSASILSAAASPDGRFIACGGCDGKIRLWDVSSGRLVRELAVSDPAPISMIEWGAGAKRMLGVTGESKWAAYGDREPHLRTRHLYLWNLEDGREIPLALPKSGGVEAATFSPDGQFVATVGIGSANRIWRAESAEACTGELPHPAAAYCAAFSADGQRLVTGAADGFLRAWDVRSGQRLFEFPAHRGAVRHLQFSPDGRRIVTVSQDQYARVWNAVTGEPVGPGFKHGGDLYLADWSPDGQRLITSGLSHDIRTWEAISGQNVLPPMAHALGLARLHYSADGRMVAAASLDHTARVWDAFTAEPVILPVNHGQPASEALLLDGGRRLFTAGADGTGRLTDLAPASLPTESLGDYARAVCSHDLDSFEALRKSNKDQVVESFRRVRAQHPEFFVAP